MRLVVCSTPDGKIGRNNDLIFHIKKDMDVFVKATNGRTLICGRNTYFGLKPSVFKRCKVIVVSKVLSLHPEDLHENSIAVQTFNEAVKLAGKDGVFIGGGRIYDEAINRGLVTEIFWNVVLNKDIEADTFFNAKALDEFILKNCDCYRVYTSVEADGEDIDIVFIEAVKREVIAA